MSTLVANRIHSAYPRSIRGSPANIRTPHIKQRPISSTAARRSHTDIYEVPPLRTTTTSSGERNDHQRPKTSHIRSGTNGTFSIGQLPANEVERLLLSLKRDNTFIVQVDCLADYGKLVETINLHQTPVSYESLYALQKRENRIVQRNACRDTRFHSLLGSLEPIHTVKVKTIEFKHNNFSEYRTNANRMNY